ncbi:hypothetical protein ACOSQ2_006390 [Xanthoceras sorbifolium]
MGGCSYETESWVVSGNTFQDNYETQPLNMTMSTTRFDQESEYDDLTTQFSKLKSDDGGTDGNSLKLKKKKIKTKKNQVLLEGYLETDSEDDLKRTKSLTDDDLDELKGCLDLGFGFSYDEIPELCNTLPALELCYSMSQKFMDEHHKSPDTSPVAALPDPVQSPIASWKISSPGDHPEDVKARLKFWAQAVACTVKLCS